MKIKTIRLFAYGPFTQTTLDLSSGSSDFHLVVGPNEAGKSSTLRALRHLFFGIPTRTADNFLHPYSDLRIGASLKRSDGQTIDFVRRKGLAKTLRGADDEGVLDDQALSSFLGGIHQDLFEQMFAIGHDDLIRGGEEIVSGKGRIGEALFAAGAGLIRLQRIQQGFDQDCGALFKPSGSTPAINKSITEIKAVRKEQKQSLLLAKTWQTHDRNLRQAQKQLAAVNSRLEQKKQRIARLERIHDALPLIARKREIETELIAFRGIPDLADDFGDKRRDAEKDMAIANRDFERFQKQIDKIRQRLNDIQVSDILIEHASAIESLQHELGSFRKAQKDRPGLEGRMRTLRHQAGEILAEIGDAITGTAGQLPPLPPSTVGEIQNLSKAVERLQAKLESAGARQRKLYARLDMLNKKRSQLSMPAEVTALETAVTSAQDVMALHGQSQDLERSIQTLHKDLTRRISRQRLWAGSLEQVDTLSLPATETIDRFDRHLDAVGRRVEQLQGQQHKVQEEISGIETDLQSIDLAHIVPTESDLNDVRALRDRGWKIIRGTLSGHPVPASEQDAFCRESEAAASLPDAFEWSMKRADDIADRLRLEADQVSRKAYLRARHLQLSAVLEKTQQELADEAAAGEDLKKSWKQLWTPVGEEFEPLSPPEMRSWLLDMLAIREKLGELRAAASRRDAIASDLDGSRSRLHQAMIDTGAPSADDACLPEMIHAAKAFIKAQRLLGTRIAAMDQEIDALNQETADVAAEVDDLNRALSGWTSDWEKNISRMGIKADASPTAVLAVIESVRDAKSKLNEAEVLKKRIDGIERDAAAFGQRVKQLVTVVAAALSDEPKDRAAELLYARLTAARRDESEKRSLTEQMQAAQKNHKDAEVRILNGQALLSALCREAGCETADALIDIQRQAQRRKTLLQNQAAIDDQVRRLGAGATVEEFITEASAVDADGITAELERLSEDVEHLEQDRSALEQTIGSEMAERKRMDGSAAAASYAEKAERLLASLESQVQAYARLKIASVILARTVEQYRSKHQGPLISRASELFAQMTLGAFSSLRAEYDEKGNPILVGIRSNTHAKAAQVTVDGMSDGTADQLYLALRLASLEQYLAHNEPLPFIVDDILLRFDDDRALATLEVLFALSQKMQVLFFTHHRHLADLIEGSETLKPAVNILSLN